MSSYLVWPLVALLLVLWYRGAAFAVWAAVLAVIVYMIYPEPLFMTLYLALNALLLIPALRSQILSRPLVSLINRMHLMPKISDTEKTALRAGTVWIDGEIFSGKPNFSKIFKESYPSLTPEERSFLDNEAQRVCDMTNDYEVFEKRDLPDEVWEYLKQKRFFGMIIPKKYGGLGFSALGHSAVIQKLASFSQPLAITTMVPNSLGPAELILHYGTDHQRDYYLPRLADGRDIPCFALTEPLAGSDATSIRSVGVLFKEMDQLKIRLDFEKRYITLGSVATLIGLAFKLKDPENLLGQGEDLGITCALVRSDLEGVRQGERHNPLGVPFINSPLWGKDVVISVDDVIGARDGIGKGWGMLMESLAVGRGISLPSTCTGGVKLSARVSGAYAMVREQFGISVGKFEGIESILGHMAAMTYMIDAARTFTIGAIDEGKKPSVINAVMKYHTTELFRKTINDAMDVVGGAGISLGERNLLGHAYMGAPIAITVEGANIMTRTLIQFGQGVIRCHPYAYKEIEALSSGDVKAFDSNFFAHIGFFFRNLTRMSAMSLTRGYIYMPKSKGVAGYYERKLMWNSATFAFLTDLLMGYFGGELKQKEKISARFGDILSYSYLLIATLRRFEAEGSAKEDAVFVRYIGDFALSKIQKAYDEIAKNLFTRKRVMGIIFKPFGVMMRMNRMGHDTNDIYLEKLAAILTTQNEKRDRLTDEIYLGKQLGLLEEAFTLQLRSAAVIKKIKKAVRAKILPKAAVADLVDLSVEKTVITKEEAKLLEEAIAAKEAIVQVDSFDVSTFVRS